MQDDELIIYTVFDHPADFPDEFVVRRFYSGANGTRPDSELYARSRDVNEIYTLLSLKGLVRLERDESDDPKIMCSFI